MRVPFHPFLISDLFITLMGHIHKIAKLVKQVKMKSRPISSRTYFSSLSKVFVYIFIMYYDYVLLNAYVPLYSGVKALAVYDSLDGVNRLVVFSLLYFQMFLLSSDVITPALVQEGTSRSGVSFPPPTHPIIASPAYPLPHSGSLSLLSESLCPDTDVCLLSHPLIKAVDLQLF